MKRRTLLGAAAMAGTGLGISSCSALGGGSGSGNELTFWNPLTGDDGSYMRQIVDAYNATKPTFTVKFQPMAGDDMYTKIYNVAGTGSDLPDLLIIHGPRVAELATAGILDTTEALTSEQSTLSAENYLAQAWDSAALAGKQYGIPLDLHGVIGYYNKDLVAQYGVENFLDDGFVTMDELLSLKGVLPEGTYAFPGLFIPGLVQAWQYNLQVPIATSDGGGVQLTDGGFHRSFEALVELQEAGLLAPEDADSAQVFNSGKALFIPDGTWGISGHAAVQGLNFGIMNGIQLQASNPVNLMESHLFARMVNKSSDPQRQTAVAAFLEYVRTNCLPWAKAGQVVASREVFDSSQYAQFPQSFLTSTPEAQALMRTDNYIYLPYVGDVLWSSANDIVYGRTSIDAGLESMQKTVSDQISEAKQS